MTKDKLLKKRPRNVKIDDDTFCVRSMTIAETIQSDAIGTTPDKYVDLIAYVLGRCVIDRDGQPVFESESDPAIQELPTDVALLLVEEIRKATRPTKSETLVKN